MACQCESHPWCQTPQRSRSSTQLRASAGRYPSALNMMRQAVSSTPNVPESVGTVPEEEGAFRCLAKSPASVKTGIARANLPISIATAVVKFRKEYSHSGPQSSARCLQSTKHKPPEFRSSRAVLGSLKDLQVPSSYTRQPH